MGQLNRKWIIRLVIMYMALSLLEVILNWKYWVLGLIGMMSLIELYIYLKRQWRGRKLYKAKMQKAGGSG